VKFLIDQCLPPELAEMARRRGYIESVHVSHRNRSGATDWHLMPYILLGYPVRGLDLRDPQFARFPRVFI
jgi:Domain of unknown function (DUF5615)